MTTHSQADDATEIDDPDYHLEELEVDASAQAIAADAASVANERVARATVVRSAFSPSAPITKKDLFAGRTKQLMQLIDAVTEPGQHAVIYGERGVGKTSMAAVCLEIFAPNAVKINCQSNDTYSTIWKKALSKFQVSSEMHSFGFNSEAKKKVSSAMAFLEGIKDLTPDHVCGALTTLSGLAPLTVFLDEFDRLDASIHLLMADTLKTLSDEAVRATVVIVGVADDVDTLISEHASVERALQQISMPRMSSTELSEIINKGLATVNMSIAEDVRRRITALSQGLPHYTHLLTQQAAIAAVWRGSDDIVQEDLSVGISKALAKAQESVHDLYYRATFSVRDNLYKQVLLACAAAKVDDRGYFTASSVRLPLRLIVGRTYEIAQFALHLNQFSSERGPVLKKEGTRKKFRYRFVNPLMQPYVLMKGLDETMITASQLTHLEMESDVVYLDALGS